ncbi:hypothetical protein EDB19DRAFT_2030296 [Suillus lakei]|nr:hypothetical protein EDB19DRAFT_2030296 [Suillus lakei]
MDRLKERNSCEPPEDVWSSVSDPKATCGNTMDITGTEYNIKSRFNIRASLQGHLSTKSWLGLVHAVFSKTPVRLNIDMDTSIDKTLFEITEVDGALDDRVARGPIDLSDAPKCWTSTCDGLRCGHPNFEDSLQPVLDELAIAGDHIKSKSGLHREMVMGVLLGKMVFGLKSPGVETGYTPDAMRWGGVWSLPGLCCIFAVVGSLGKTNTGKHQLQQP